MSWRWDVLVTGGAGFIGHHLVRELLNLGLRVRVLDDLSTGDLDRLKGLPVDFMCGTILDPITVAKAAVGVSTVVHLAAKISVPESYRHSYSYIQTNTLGTLQVCRACRDLEVPRLVFASTCAVYGETLSPYAISKRDAEDHVQASGSSWANLRLYNVYGPGQSAEYAGVITAFAEAAARGEPLTIHGDGEQTRDFIHVRDVVSLMSLLAIDHSVVGTFDVGTGVQTSINELAGFFSEQTHHVTPREGDVRRSVSRPEPALTEAGWKPLVSLRDWAESEHPLERDDPVPGGSSPSTTSHRGPSLDPIL